MINTTFAVEYAAEIYEVSLLSWAYSSSTHYAINRIFIDFYDSVKRIYIFYEIRKILTLIYVSLASDPDYLCTKKQ